MKPQTQAFLHADEAHAQVIESCKRRQQMTRAAGEAVEFPDQEQSNSWFRCYSKSTY